MIVFLACIETKSLWKVRWVYQFPFNILIISIWLPVLVFSPGSWQRLLQQGPESSEQTKRRNTEETQRAMFSFMLLNWMSDSPFLSYTDSLWRLHSNRRNWSEWNQRPRSVWGWRCCCKYEWCGPSREEREREREYFLFRFIAHFYLLK